MTASNHPQPVLLIRTNDGELIGACTRDCYDNEDFQCSCICRGVNHGVGYRTACANAVDGIQVDWTKTRKKVPRSQCQVIVPRGVRRNADQLTLFDVSSPPVKE